MTKPMTTKDHILADIKRGKEKGKDLTKSDSYKAYAFTALLGGKEGFNWFSIETPCKNFVIVEFPIGTDKIKVCGNSANARTRTYSPSGYIKALKKAIGTERFETALSDWEDITR